MAVIHNTGRPNVQVQARRAAKNRVFAVRDQPLNGRRHTRKSQPPI
jgi:hypothetical protein